MKRGALAQVLPLVALALASACSGSGGGSSGSTGSSTIGSSGSTASSSSASASSGSHSSSGSTSSGSSSHSSSGATSSGTSSASVSSSTSSGSSSASVSGSSSGSVSGSSSSSGATGVPYSVGGSVTGLQAAGLVLANNGGDSLPVADDATTFTFATLIASGGSYAVTVANQPPFQSCVVTSGGSGPVTANVTSVVVTCSPVTPTITTVIGGTPITNVAAPEGVVVTDAGEVFFINQVWDIPHGSSADVADVDALVDGTFTPVTDRNTGLNVGLVADGLGNVYATTTQYGCLVSVLSDVTNILDDGGPNSVGCVNDSIPDTSYTASDTYYLTADYQGNLYVDDANAGIVLELPVGNLGAGFTIASNVSGPSGLVVDSSGTVYVYSDNAGYGVLDKIVPDGGTVQFAPAPPTTFPLGGSGTSGLGTGGHQMTIDGYGNIYISMPGELGIRLVAPSGQSFLISSAFADPVGVAVNWTGTQVYVADQDKNEIDLMTP